MFLITWACFLSFLKPNNLGAKQMQNVRCKANWNKLLSRFWETQTTHEILGFEEGTVSLSNGTQKYTRVLCACLSKSLPKHMPTLSFQVMTVCKRLAFDWLSATKVFRKVSRTCEIFFGLSKVLNRNCITRTPLPASQTFTNSLWFAYGTCTSVSPQSHANSRWYPQMPKTQIFIQ